MFRSFFPSLVATSGSPSAEKDGAVTSSQEAASSKGDDAAGTENKAVANRIQKMDSIIRRKLHGTGAQYNMKVVIRGERGVGKTTLLRRLQGLPFEEKYTPTPEILTTTINNWEYRKNQDVVKIEVWDVVDKGLARGGVARVREGDDLEDAVAGLPPDAGSARGGRALAVLDASVVNVYQGANAVIFMVDPYRPQTLDKVEEALAEAPVGLPVVILLNFRDKIEEDSAAKATEQAKAAPAERPARPSPTPTDPPKEVANDSSVEKEESVEAGSKADAEDKAGAWEHIVTLESARLMVDRVRETDTTEGRGGGRRISLFDCSMKNCFGLRVLYTYLNVPFLELKRQSLLQQAKIAAETLEREHRELEGFIGGHSYANYMKHLLSSDIDPTAGRSVPANPPGRPMISSLPPPSSSTGDASIERRGSTDSHNKKDKKKKHHKDSKDKSSKKKHRHKVDKSVKEEPPEYEGKVTDPKEFAPVTKKTATEELEDFFGADSDGDSDKGIRDRNKVVNAMKPGALTASNAFEDEGTDSDDMPAPSMSRLKRVTAPAKAPRQEEKKSLVRARESDVKGDIQNGDKGGHQVEEKRTPNDENHVAEITAGQAVEEIDIEEEEVVTEKKGLEAQGLGLEADKAAAEAAAEAAADIEDAVDDVEVVDEDTECSSVTGTSSQLTGIVTVSVDKTEMPREGCSLAASEGSIAAVVDDTVNEEHAEEGGETAANERGREDVATISDQAGTGHEDDHAAGEDEREVLDKVEGEGNEVAVSTTGEIEEGDSIKEFDLGTTEERDGAKGGIAEDFFAEGSSSDDGPHVGIDGSQTAIKSSRLEDMKERDDGDEVVRESNDAPSVDRVDQPPSPRFIASNVTQHGADTGFGYTHSTVAMRKSAATVSSEGLSEAAKAAVAAALANASVTATTTTSRSSSRRDHDGAKSRKKSRHKEKRRQDSGEEGVYQEGHATAGDNGIYTSSRSEKERKGKKDSSSSKRRHRKSPG